MPNFTLNEPVTGTDRVGRSDGELLTSVAGGDAAALGELARRHLGWVHAVAARQARDAHLADDAVQAVFLALRRRAGSIRGPALPGWLHQATRYAVANERRAARRRLRWERAAARPEAWMASTDDANPFVPLLDDAIAALGEKDRAAVVERYLRGRDLGDVAAVVGGSPQAAQKRLERAVGRLRQYFARHAPGSAPPTSAMVLTALDTAGQGALHGSSHLVELITAGPSVSSFPIGIGWARVLAVSKAVKAGVSAVVVLIGVGMASWVAHCALPLPAGPPAPATRPAANRYAATQPSDLDPPETGPEPYCTQQIMTALSRGKSVAILCMGYATDHGGQLPIDLGQSLKGANSTALYRDPSNHRPATWGMAQVYVVPEDERLIQVPDVPTPDWVNHHASFSYLPRGDGIDQGWWGYESANGGGTTPAVIASSVVLLHTPLDTPYETRDGPAIAVTYLDGHSVPLGLVDARLEIERSVAVFDAIRRRRPGDPGGEAAIPLGAARSGGSHR